MLYLLFSIIGYFASPVIKLTIVAITLITAVLFAVFRFGFKNVSAYRALCVILSSLTVAVSLISSFCYFDVYAGSVEEYYGDNHTIEALVTSSRTYDVNFSTYDVTVTKIDGKETNHKAILVCTYTSELEPGFIVTANVSAEKFDPDTTGISMHSDGIFIQYTSAEEASALVIDEDDFHLTVALSQLNKSLAHIFNANLDETTAEICSAMLLGNKDQLNNLTERNFSRAGGSHLLALSGMHVSIIMGLLMLLLKKLRTPSKLIAVILIVCSVCYLLLTGIKISAARSVIMVSLVYLSTLSSRRNDSLTSLAFAGALIMLISPCSVLDVGFWMSFGATLGILIYVPSFTKLTARIESRSKLLKPITYVFSALIAGIFAMMPLLIVLCVFIKKVSLASVITSAMLSLPASAIILFSILLLVFHNVTLVSAVIVKVLGISAHFMTDYCAKVSDIDNVMISLNYPFATIAAIVLGVTFAYSMIKKSKNMFRSLIPFALSLVLFVSAMYVYNYSEKDKVNVSYINVSSTADMLVISSNGETIICDVGAGSNSSYYATLDSVNEARSTEIRAIIISKYANRHISSLYYMFTGQKVYELWLPYPETDDDYYKMVQIVEYAQRYGVDVFVYRDGETLRTFGNTEITLYSYSIERSVTPISLITVKTPEKQLVYCSPAFNETTGEEREQIDDILSKSNYVIFGSRGPKTKTTYSIPSENKVALIAFSDKTRVAYYTESSERAIAYSIIDDRCQFCLND